MELDDLLEVVQLVPLDWFDEHGGIWLWVLALVIVLLIIGIPFFFKYRNRIKIRQEIDKIKKDLMVWGNLSDLAKGGDKADEARTGLTMNVELLKELYAEGMTNLKQANYAKDHPWFLVVGEPRSGKSQLLSNSSLELIEQQSVITNTGPASNRSSQPVRFWFGSQAVVIDVEGRLFFDRWLGGSSAEWLALLKLVEKNKGRLPLSGIVVVIPADALIADDASLTRRKAHLIATELAQLTRVLSMVLPVNIVISKLDIVTGFESYFGGLSESMRRRVFGWEQTGDKDFFDSDQFDGFWKKTVDTLRQGVDKLFLSNSLRIETEGTNRFDATSEVFLFPECFDDLQDNLKIYLESIFGRKANLKRHELLLEGVFFTSSEKGEYYLNKDFALAKDVAIDDAPMQKTTKIRSKSYFVRDLFINWIFGSTSKASFTQRALVRKALPYFLAMAVFVGVGCFWLSSVFFMRPELEQRLDGEIGDVDKVAELFDSKSLIKSPLLADDGKTLFNEPMDSLPTTSRLNFYMQNLTALYKEIPVPSGYWISSLLINGSLNIARNSRRYLFNEIQADMSFLPLVRIIGNKFLNSKGEVFTETKGEALTEYLSLSFYKEDTGWRLNDENVLYKHSTMESFLRYGEPGLSYNIASVLAVFDPQNDKNADALNAEVVTSTLYRKASRKATEDWLSAWQGLNIYPDSEYGKMRSALSLASLLVYRYGWLVKSAHNPEISVTEWKVEARDVLRTLEALNEEDVAVLNKMLATISKADDKNKPEAGSNEISSDMTLRSAYHKFLGILGNDFSVLERFGRYQTTSAGASAEQEDAVLSPDNINKVRQQVEEGLKKQLEQLEKNLAYLKTSPFCRSGEEKSKHTFEEELGVLKDFLQTVVRSPSDIAMTSSEEIINTWEKIKQGFSNKRALLDSLFKRESGSTVRQDFGDSIKVVIDREEMAELAAFAQKSLDLYPPGDGAGSLLEALRIEASKIVSLNKSAVDPRLKNAGPILGLVPGQSLFTIEVLDTIIDPLAYLYTELTRESKKEFSGAIKDVLKSERFRNLIDADANLAREFIRFWGGLTDSLRPSVSNWKDFHAFANRSHAFEINADLLSIYDLSSQMVSKVLPSILDTEAQKERDSIIETLGKRRKMLNLHYTESCALTLATWASLPDNALQAYRQVSQQSETERRSTLLLAAGDNAVPWWDRFVKDGTKFMKQDAKAASHHQVVLSSSDLGRFPLSANPLLRAKPISSEEMRALAARLGHSRAKAGAQGAEAAADAVAAVAKGANMAAQFDSPLNHEIPELKVKLDIIEKLALGDKPIIWTLLLPTSSEQMELRQKSGMLFPSALGRYRYLTVESGGKESHLQGSSGGKQSTLLAEGNLENDGITLNFFRFSDSKAPSAKATLTGLWPLLKPYLSGKAVASEDKKTWWIPLMVRDEVDEPSVFFVGIRFSKELPAPDKWSE